MTRASFQVGNATRAEHASANAWEYDGLIVYDDGDVLSLAMSQAELAYLDALHESCFQDWFGGWLGEMAPFEATLLGSVDLNALPSLRPVVEAVFQRQRLNEPVHADWYGILAVIESDGQ